MNQTEFEFILSCRPTEFPFWFGLVLPFVIIYLFNWLIFALIMWSLARKRLQSKDNVKELTRTAVGLSPLFGLGWGLGLAATTSDVDEVTFSIQVLFSVFVGFQGFSIFIFHGRAPRRPGSSGGPGFIGCHASRGWAAGSTGHPRAGSRPRIHCHHQNHSSTRRRLSADHETDQVQSLL